MAAEHARVVRGAVPAGLFVVDLDRFKSVNDRFGHGVGDQVLVEVVRRLVDGLRPPDIVARWGGEEIAVLAPGVKGPAAAGAVRRAHPQADPRLADRDHDRRAAADRVRRRNAPRRLRPARRRLRPGRPRALRRKAHARCDGGAAAAAAHAAARDPTRAVAGLLKPHRLLWEPDSAVTTPSPTKIEPET